MASAPLVLVVDDEPDIRECLRDLIEGHLRFTTLTAASGPDALAVLAALDPAHLDLVVVDYHMAPLNGLETLSATRRLHPGVPTVLCTAYADLEVALDAVNQVHVDRFVTKPLDPAAFLALVDELVGRRRAERSRLAALHRAAGVDPKLQEGTTDSSQQAYGQGT